MVCVSVYARALLHTQQLCQNCFASLMKRDLRLKGRINFLLPSEKVFAVQGKNLVAYSKMKTFGL